jgi:hypothetical protein
VPRVSFEEHLALALALALRDDFLEDNLSKQL